MKPEVKKAWVAALRSGEFVQERGRLRGTGENAYCCLGVLCELFRRETGRGAWVEEGFCSGPEVRIDLPVQDVLDWADLPYDNPGVRGRALGAWNDGVVPIDSDELLPGLSFSDIADLIEEEL